MKFLSSELNIKENLLFSLRTYRVLWLILIITIVFDYLTTVYFISALGVEAEANQVVNWLIENLGLSAGLLIGKLLQLLSVAFVACLGQRVGRIFLVFVILLNCWAVFINTLPIF